MITSFPSLSLPFPFVILGSRPALGQKPIPALHGMDNNRVRVARDDADLQQPRCPVWADQYGQAVVQLEAADRVPVRVQDVCVGDPVLASTGSDDGTAHA